MQLARLAATLANNRRPKSSEENTATMNLAHCELSISGAEKLWNACAELFRQTPAQDRRGLRLEDLVSLAATLAWGKPMRDIDRRFAAERALYLWLNCRQQLIPSTKPSAEFLDFKSKLAESQKLLTSNRPKKFPVPLKKAMRLWMRQKRKPDRFNKFRHYLRDSFKTCVPSDHKFDGENASYVPAIRHDADCEQLADTEINRLMKNGLTAAEYDDHVLGLRRWLKRDRVEKQSEKSSKGGKAKAQKTLGAPKIRTNPI